MFIDAVADEYVSMQLRAKMYRCSRRQICIDAALGKDVLMQLRAKVYCWCKVVTAGEGY